MNTATTYIINVDTFHQHMVDPSNDHKQQADSRSTTYQVYCHATITSTDFKAIHEHMEDPSDNIALASRLKEHC